VRRCCLLMALALVLTGVCTAGERMERLKTREASPVPAAETKGKVFDKDFIVERLSQPAQSEEAAAIAFSSDAILFGYGSAKLLEASHPQLMEIAKALSDPALSHIPFFFVDGHTCTIGTEESNCRLSWDRAESVIRFLKETGKVPPDRLQARGFGSHDPQVSNVTDETRRINRRVVLKSGLLSLQKDEEMKCKAEDRR
jgi:outer membrane protein OmpA-like peptidoglycan-associated protein